MSVGNSQIEGSQKRFRFNPGRQWCPGSPSVSKRLRLDPTSTRRIRRNAVWLLTGRSARLGRAKLEIAREDPAQVWLFIPLSIESSTDAEPIPGTPVIGKWGSINQGKRSYPSFPLNPSVFQSFRIPVSRPLVLCLGHTDPQTGLYRPSQRSLKSCVSCAPSVIHAKNLQDIASGACAFKLPAMCDQHLGFVADLKVGSLVKIGQISEMKMAHGGKPRAPKRIELVSRIGT